MITIRKRTVRVLLPALLILPLVATGAFADPVPGGSVDPTAIPKYVIPLVIPPVMKHNGTGANNYDIAVRQLKQQILPGGIWNTLNGRNDMYDPTTVWSYGPAADPVPDSKNLGGSPATAPAANSQFNYPAYTVETMSGTPVNVRWINDLVDKNGNYLPHLLPIDQTVHWANPSMECRVGVSRTDCAGISQKHYKGPVPIVTHVHGAHVGPESDGYPEAWWLPRANNIPAGYATHGTLFDDKSGANPGNLGYADFTYPQDQPATTLWYHDHSLGMTRSNVYAGPAGFWLIRGGDNDKVDNNSTDLPWDGVLPGPAPVAGESVGTVNFPAELGGQRAMYREIPILIQDRSFDMNGKQLFYPKNRSFFEGVDPKDLKIQFAPVTDVLPSWQPEAFFNVMVVNGVSWPELKVAQALYRFRFLNGCNSRFLWLKFDDPDVKVYQIGAEQGFLPAPVNMNAQDLDRSRDGTAQILLGLAERADVIVDFRGLEDKTEIELLNIGPDEPFGGGIPGEDFESADPDTTGKVMRFVVDKSLNGKSPTDPEGRTPATDPGLLALNAEGPLGAPGNTRKVSLNEKESEIVCVLAGEDNEEFLVPIKNVDCQSVPPAGKIVVPFGPTEALLGTVNGSGATATGRPLKWTSVGVGTVKTVTVPSGDVDVWVTENPALGATEDWEIYNFTEDAHPIHLHLVRFQVKSRILFDGEPSPNGNVQDWESGYKDTVIAYPGEITTVRATFDVPGLYLWHCHIVEHEDNEMMRPFFVGP